MYGAVAHWASIKRLLMRKLHFIVLLKELIWEYVVTNSVLPSLLFWYQSSEVMLNSKKWNSLAIGNQKAQIEASRVMPNNPAIVVKIMSVGFIFTLLDKASPKLRAVQKI
jgi:hypothetical protein